MARAKTPPAKLKKPWYLRMRVIALVTLFATVIGVVVAWWEPFGSAAPLIGDVNVSPRSYDEAPEPAAKSGEGEIVPPPARSRPPQPQTPPPLAPRVVVPNREGPATPTPTVNSIHVERSPGAITGANVTINTVTTTIGPEQ